MTATSGGRPVSSEFHKVPFGDVGGHLRDYAPGESKISLVDCMLCHGSTLPNMLGRLCGLGAL